jgi:hypothetical protein
MMCGKAHIDNLDCIKKQTGAKIENLRIRYRDNRLCIQDETKSKGVHTAIPTAIPTQASPNQNCLNPNVTGGRGVGIAVVGIAG